MGILLNCNECGHHQMIGHNPVDGRLKWWTRCKACGKGNFMAPVDEGTMRALKRASELASEPTRDEERAG